MRNEGLTSREIWEERINQKMSELIFYSSMDAN